ncbi:MAG: hypothetical protein H3Z53_10500 [archaeon]|nr:hypothetical protein [archaeon]MCP8315671.1 hypothetical protein [archaeon]MCP8320494.1 hypothetical protein [archaeon]
MTKVELQLSLLQIICDCGRVFIAENLEPECPYCNRKYVSQIHDSPKGIVLKITRSSR